MRVSRYKWEQVPGTKVRMDKVEMNFHYTDYFGSAPSTGYETLIYDCMIGDATLFQRADNTEAGWRVVEPIFDVWSGEAPQFPDYAAGTWGPKEADDLLAKTVGSGGRLT